MTLPKIIAYISIFLFSTIGLIALFKEKPSAPSASSPVETALEIELDEEIQVIPHTEKPKSETSVPSASIVAIAAVEEKKTVTEEKNKEAEIKKVAPEERKKTSVVSSEDLPDANRIEELFNTQSPKLPIVETLTYSSTVSWQKGRSAWISDYASHYGTSRHFIARSLRGKPDYFNQEVAKGDKFNVLRKDKNFEFYLLVDTSRCKMWFYYLDLDQKKKVLLKTYRVGLGRIDSSKQSGYLTPVGKYSLGNRIVVYKPKMMGTYQGKKTEMITIFGTRWIPFEKEIGTCTLPAKGFGIHGTPWKEGPNGVLADNTSSIGKYEGDGCIRLATPDIEEIYAIIITKPTTIEIVRDFHESSLAGMAN